VLPGFSFVFTLAPKVFMLRLTVEYPDDTKHISSIVSHLQSPRSNLPLDQNISPDVTTCWEGRVDIDSRILDRFVRHQEKSVAKRVLFAPEVWIVQEDILRPL
jgi:hypothetical protein